jgi:dTDP-4-dehydrorhamnose reductase
MRILITGANGQLGLALQRALTDHTALPTDVGEMDITNYRDTLRVFEEFKPDAVIHAAAYTNVDGCERDPDGAYRLNALGTKYVALACQSVGATLVYVSTNCVFDGNKTTPYLEYDAPNPISVYGSTKLAGEQIVQTLMNRFYIVRTAWLYGDGPRNFIRTVVRLANERDSITMVSDEVGSPTYARDLARGIAELIETSVYGVYHLTNEGICSRYDLTAEILRLIGKTSITLLPMSLKDYDRPSRPPLYSPLRNVCAAELGIVLPPWEEALKDYLCTSQ